jgi:hypothetical protein
MVRFVRCGGDSGDDDVMILGGWEPLCGFAFYGVPGDEAWSVHGSLLCLRVALLGHFIGVRIGHFCCSNSPILLLNARPYLGYSWIGYKVWWFCIIVGWAGIRLWKPIEQIALPWVVPDLHDRSEEQTFENIFKHFYDK